MKALKKICTALMLLAFAFVFASCSSGSDSDDDDDQSITLSDGSYTLAITQTSDGMVEKYDIKATRLTRYTHNIILLIIRSAYATLKS